MTVFAEVALLEVTAFSDIQLAHFAIRILHRFRLDGDHFVAVFVSERIVPFRTRQANQGSFIAYGLNVFILKVNALAGALAASLHTGLTFPDHDHAVADADEGIEYTLAYTFAIAEQKHDSGQSPHDAHHGQDGTKTIAGQSIPALQDQFFYLHSVTPDANIRSD